jgi:hypothetical protein
MDDFLFHLQYEESVRDNESKFCEGDLEIVATGSCTIFCCGFPLLLGIVARFLITDVIIPFDAVACTDSGSFSHSLW